MKPSRLAIFLSLAFSCIAAFSGCRLIGLGGDLDPGALEPSPGEGAARVTVRVVIPATPGQNGQNRAQGGIVPAIRAAEGAHPTISFRLALFQPGKDPAVTVLTRTVVSTDGTVRIEFPSLPPVTCLGELSIGNGTLGGKTDFHGACDLTVGDNTLEIVPKGCGHKSDILAGALREVWNSPELLQKPWTNLVSILGNSGAPFLSGSATVDIYEKVFDRFVTDNLSTFELTKLELSPLKSILFASGKGNWAKGVGEVASTPAGASEKPYSFERVVKQGFGSSAFVAWKAGDGGRFGIAKLNSMTGDSDASLTVEGPCGPVALLPDGGLIIGGTVGGYPILISWKGSGTHWVNPSNFATFSGGWAHRFELGTGIATTSLIEYVDYVPGEGGRLYCIVFDPSSGRRKGFRVDPTDGRAVEISAAPDRVGIWAVSGNGCINVGWDSLPGSHSYSLYWANVPDISPASYSGLASGVISPFRHSGLIASRTYYYRVVPFSEAGIPATSSNVVGAIPGPFLDLELSSPAFAEGGAIPPSNAEASGVSPELVWRGVPESTRSLAIVCTDPDAPSGTFCHWLIYDIPPATTFLSAGIATLEVLPNGAIQGRNDYGEIGYGGPNPPPGNPHSYRFTLLALDASFGGETGLASQTLADRISGHVIASTTLTGVYTQTGILLDVGQVASFSLGYSTTIELLTPNGNEEFGLALYSKSETTSYFTLDVNGGGQQVARPRTETKKSKQMAKDSFMRSRGAAAWGRVQAGLPAVRKRIRANIAPAVLEASRTFKISCDDGVKTVTATLEYLSSRCAIYLDVAITYGDPDVTVPDGALIASFGAEFTERIFPFIEANYGPSFDVDGNGVVIILISRLVGRDDCWGWFDPEDFVTPATTMNGSDMFYLDLINATEKSQFFATLVHEFQHLVNYAAHQKGGVKEDEWLDEGLAVSAEMRFLGVRISADFIDAFVTSPTSVCMTNWGGSMADYGADGLFIKYLFEQSGTESIRLLCSGANGSTSLSGTTNVVFYCASSGDFWTLFSRWTMALLRYGRGLPVDPVYDYREAGLFVPGFPLSVSDKEFTQGFSASLRGCSPAFVRLVPPVGYSAGKFALRLVDLIDIGFFGCSIVRLK